MKRVLFLLAGMAIVITACGGGPVSNATTGVAPDRADGDWQLVSGLPTVDGWPVTMSIDGTTMGGTAACNNYGGEASADPSGAFSARVLNMNEMGCEPAIQASEQAFVTTIAKTHTWQREGNELTLSGDGITLVFEELPPVPAADLVGTEWVLETLIQGDVATTPGGSEATLLLKGDGTVEGSTGCRTLHGTWTLANAEVFFPDFGADGECEASLAAQDNLVVTVLGDGFRAEVDGDILTLTSVGDEGLQYRSR